MMSKKFSVIVSVPKDSKSDKIQDVAVKGIQILFFLAHFKKLKLTRAEGFEGDGDESTDEHVYEFEY
jgi:hypothetical protein